MTLIAILIIALYTLLIGVLIVGFFKVKEFNSHSESASNSFSIIIPFRNEADNLPGLLKSISELNYPNEKFEILLINDDSQDGFRALVNVFIQEYSHLHIKMIENYRKSSSPKKDAIETGIQHSKFKWILTTDADCILPNLWLRIYDAFILKNDPYFIAGPVVFSKPKSFLNHFQQLDLSALIGSTIGGFGIKKPFICSGANLCYRKDIFLQLNGFVGNNHIASGDDIFLLEKMNLSYKDKTAYLKSKNAIVETKSEKNLKSLIQQRIRWASKTTSYSNNFAKVVGLIVLCTNFLVIYLFIEQLITTQLSSFFIYFVIVKYTIDGLIIGLTSDFLSKIISLRWLPLVFLFHPFFTVYIAFISIFKTDYIWKQRKSN